MFGQHYINKAGIACTVVAVTDKFIKVTYNNETAVKYSKMLYAGVYAGLSHGMPFILSDTIKPIDDSTLEHKLNGPHKKRNIYFMLNTHGETYFEIFEENYGK